ncbi:MAG: hypothetical protein AB1295_06045 [Candidatus Micrarchaeota archaeon]
MNEDIISLACAGGLILAVILIAAFLVFGMRPFKYAKRKEGSNTCLTITAKRNLAKITVFARFTGESVKFERQRVRKDQSIDFVFPASKEKIKVVVETEKGKENAFEV